MPQALAEQLSREQQITALEKDWATNPRWKGIKRGYSAADVVRHPLVQRLVTAYANRDAKPERRVQP